MTCGITKEQDLDLYTRMVYIYMHHKCAHTHTYTSMEHRPDLQVDEQEIMTVGITNKGTRIVLT